jgi:L,D-peptidoglycan transpeptidase YkuD (ErfK/YbiS/YcfS/YnhG family)
MKFVIPLFILFLGFVGERKTFAVPGSSGSIDLKNSAQIILVISNNWDDLHARVYLCERNDGKWAVQKSFPAVCGKKGMAWGIGLYPKSINVDFKPGKKEGDLKSPAGVFELGKSMGYALKLTVNPRLEYMQITEGLQGVDDPVSRYYNQVVNLADFNGETKVDWKSHEEMKRHDDFYKWLITIKHNPENVAGFGSLIFFHVWKDENSGTPGCTATAEQNILELLKWLNREKHPVLIQLPKEAYLQHLTDWHLPFLKF